MATLKISDLSVGDWVRCGDENKQIKCIDLQNNNYFVHFSDPDTNDYDYAHILDIEPIPITAEILEKNGFRKNGEYNEWNIGKWDERPFIGVSIDRQSMRVKYFGNDIFIENKVVCVHQLQHALRLAGVEKEINL